MPHPDIGWAPPRIAFDPAELQEALASEKVHLEPAPELLIREFLGRLRLTHHGAPSTDIIDLAIAEFLDALGHYPADIWDEAFREWRATSRFWPAISQLRDIMQPLLDRRKRRIARLERMISPRPQDSLPTPTERRRVAVRWKQLRECLETGFDGA